MFDSLGWLWLLGEAAFKGSIVCLAILAALSFVRRPTAGVKHLAMVLGMASFILVPILSLALPQWGVLPGVLPGALPGVLSVRSSNPAISSLYDAPINSQNPLTRDAPAETPTLQPSSITPSDTLASSNARQAASVDPPPPNESVAVMASPSWSWAVAGVWFWGIGAGLALLLMCLGLGRLMWINHHARLFTIGPWVRLNRQCQSSLGIDRPVSIRVTDQCAVPLVWGVWQATILLPTSCKQWSAQQRIAVLTHEMAHIKRWDCLTHLVARIVCAMFWFHPLVWWMLYRMTLERELACDDMVLACGTRHSDYAEHLLSIGNTEQTSAHRSRLLGSAALAMVSNTRLEARIAAIVDPHRTHITMTRSLAGAMIVFVAAVTIPLSMLSAADPPPETSETPETLQIPQTLEVSDPDVVAPTVSQPVVTEPAPSPRTYSFRARLYDLRAEPLRIAPQTLDIPSPSPDRAVVFAPPIRWWSSHWSSSLNTQSVGMNMKQGHPIFTVRHAGKRKVWVKYFDVPIDVQRYPHFVMTYRALHTDEKSSQYAIYLDDGSGPDYGGLLPVQQQDLIADGELHTLSVDLQTLKPIGDLIGLAIGVHADATGHQATFELIDLRFEPPNGSARLMSSRDEPPITVQVVDSQGEPIAGATVTVDAERTNWAQSATTGNDGRATVTPWQTKTQRHMIRVTQPGMMPVEVRDMPQDPEKLVVALEPAAVYCGVIVDTHDQPLEGVAVKIRVPRTLGDPASKPGRDRIRSC